MANRKFSLIGLFCQVVRLGIALLLLVSAHFHFSNPVVFLESILQYRIIDGWCAVMIAGILPALQVFASAYLIMASHQRLGNALSAGLLVFFFAVQFYAWLVGLSIDCGCFGPYSPRISLYSVSFVGALAAASVALAWCPLHVAHRRSLSRGTLLSGD